MQQRNLKTHMVINLEYQHVVRVLLPVLQNKRLHADCHLRYAKPQGYQRPLGSLVQFYAHFRIAELHDQHHSDDNCKEPSVNIIQHYPDNLPYLVV